MANHTLTRADLVAWGANPLVTAAEFFHLDQKTFKSPNFAEGGTYAPSAVITVGGSGMTITGPLAASDARDHVFASPYKARFSDAVSITPGIELGVFRSLDVANNAQIRVGSGGAVTIQSAGELTAESGSLCTFESGSISTFNSGSNLVVAAGAVVGCAATWTQTGRFICSGASARITQVGRAATFTNADQLLGVEYDQIEMVNTSGAMVTLTLKVSTAPVPVRGEKISVRMTGAGAGGKTLKAEGSAANLAIVTGVNNANFIAEFDGTIWRIFSSVGAGITLGADAF